MRRTFAPCLVLAFLGGSAALAARDDDLAARIQRIEDRQAIEPLMVGDYPRIKGPAAIEAYFNRPRPAQGYWQTVMSRASGTTIAGAGHYEGVLKKENGTWKFLKRAFITDAPSAPSTR